MNEIPANLQYHEQSEPLMCMPFTCSNVKLLSIVDLNEYFSADGIQLYHNDCQDAIPQNQLKSESIFLNVDHT